MKWIGRMWTRSSGSGSTPLMGCCIRGYEHSGPLKCLNFLGDWVTVRLSKMESVHGRYGCISVCHILEALCIWPLFSSQKVARALPLFRPQHIEISLTTALMSACKQSHIQYDRFTVTVICSRFFILWRSLWGLSSFWVLIKIRKDRVRWRQGSR